MRRNPTAERRNRVQAPSTYGIITDLVDAFSPA